MADFFSLGIATKKKPLMARKVVNRKALREEAEAAAKAEGATKKKTPVKRKTRAKKKEKVIRMKIFWGVFNQSLKRVALYEFNQKKQAEKKASDLSTSQKTPHFVQKVKEEITE
jgi:hypothetical protein